MSIMPPLVVIFPADLDKHVLVPAMPKFNEIEDRDQISNCAIRSVHERNERLKIE